MKAKILSILGVTLLFSPAAQLANASTILVGAPDPNAPYFYGMYRESAIAAEFTLTASYHLSTIEVGLRTPTTTSFNTFDFSLQNSLTNPSTIFASAALEAPLGSVSTEVMNVNQTLLAGTYYLVGFIPGYAGTSITPGDVSGWLVSDGSYNNSAGAVADGLWDIGNLVFLTGDYFNNGTVYHAPVFTVNGDPVIVPLPPALYLFGAGLLSLLGISRRKKVA